jgi:hypothetical protein
MFNFDIFPYQPSMMVNNEMGYKTNLGGVLSIMLGFVCLLATGYFGKDLVLKLNPISTVSELYDDHPSLENDKVLLTLAMGYAGGVPIPELNKMVSFYFGYIDYDGTRKIPGMYKYYPAVKCYEENERFINNTNNVKSFLQGLSTEFYCAPKNFTQSLTGRYGRGKFQSWDIQIRFCNETVDHVKCKSMDVIKKTLKQVFIGLVLSNNLINPNNYETPIIETYASYIMRASALATRQDMLFIDKIVFKSDEGFLLETNNTKSTFLVASKESDTIAEDNPQYIFRLLVTLNNNYKEIRRVYMKVQKVAADVGGIIKFLLIIFTYFNYCFSKVYFLRYIKSRMQKNDKEIGNLTFKFGISHLYNEDPDVDQDSLSVEDDSQVNNANKSERISRVNSIKENIANNNAINPSSSRLVNNSLDDLSSRYADIPQGNIPQSNLANIIPSTLPNNPVSTNKIFTIN